MGTVIKNRGTSCVGVRKTGTTLIHVSTVMGTLYAGGHFEEFELNDAKACVLREMNEELGLCEDNIRNLSLRYVTLRRTKGEIRQNYYFFAMLNEEVSDDLVSNEGELNWFSLKQLDELEMPYTARYVMNHYCSIGQYSDKIYTGVANENEVIFLELPEF